MSGKRAQTTQDFAIGVSVFLLAVLFVFAYLPSTLASGDAEIEQRSYVADGLASSVFGNVSDTDDANQLNGTRTHRFFARHNDTAALRANYSLPATANANVTLETLQGTPATVDRGGSPIPAVAGDTYTERTGATTTRIVRLDGTRYRLVVRVW
jgi:hypothetical protein